MDFKQKAAVSIGKSTLVKMDKVPSEKWPINLLLELSEVMINYKGYEDDFDYLVVKSGKKIRKKL